MLHLCTGAYVLLKGLNLIWANSKASALPITWDCMKARSLQHALLEVKLISSYHSLEQTRSTKWRLRRSNSKSLLFSRISCASCPVSSIALSTFPSDAWWKIPKDEWNLSIKEALLPIICSNYKQFRFRKQSPASSASGEEGRNIKKSREGNKIC